MEKLLVLSVLLMSGHCLIDKNKREILAKRSDVHIRPNETTTVEVAFMLSALNKLDSVNQELGTTFLLYMTWTDSRLKWTPGPGESDTIVVYVNEIWTPPLVVSNAIEDSMFLLRDDIFPMRVSSNGTVTWIPRVSPTTACEIKPSLFPVDIQVCDINITSWVHSTAELRLVQGTTPLYHEPVNLNFFTADKSWELVKTSVEVVNQTGGYGIDYNQIKYQFHFRRHERFYWVLLVIPGICLSFLQPLVFLLSPKSTGTRISYATTILLSFLFYTSLLTSILPPIFSTDADHVFGENFGYVIISGTSITMVIIIQGIVANFLKNRHEKNDTGTGFFCLGGNDLNECYPCFIFQMVNVIIFVIYLIVYIVGVSKFVDKLSKQEVGDSVSPN